MPDQIQAPPTREAFAARSENHAAFVNMGGYDAIHTLADAALLAGFPFALIVQNGDENWAVGNAPEAISAPEVSAAALAARSEFEVLHAALTDFLFVEAVEGPSVPVEPDPTVEENRATAVSAVEQELAGENGDGPHAIALRVVAGLERLGLLRLGADAGVVLVRAESDREEKLERVAKGWLLFHGGDWTVERENEWLRLGFGESCTSKVLGDATRAALGIEP